MTKKMLERKLRNNRYQNKYVSDSVRRPKPSIPKTFSPNLGRWPTFTKTVNA
jgi:hypothetical protein